MVDTVSLVGIVNRRTEINNYISNLTIDDKMLLQLRKELYDRSWDKMKQDLKARLESRPYSHKRMQRIEDDLVRIEVLEGVESKYRINLLKRVKP